VDPQLQHLIDLQAVDTRTAALEAEATRLPREIAALESAVAVARKTVEDLRGRLDAARKNVRAREKDLDVSAAKRAKAEARLYEVKTNKEYSAVLVEIEDVKQEKSRIEEEILAHMEEQERLSADIREAEVQLKAREAEGQAQEADLRQKLAAVEADLAVVRAERAGRARELPAALIASYDRILKARAGLALAEALPSGICAGCRMAIRPQAMQELRAQADLITCESCGRYLYWRTPA
jgi:uncharacterized protein